MIAFSAGGCGGMVWLFALGGGDANVKVTRLFWSFRPRAATTPYNYNPCPILNTTDSRYVHGPPDSQGPKPKSLSNNI